MWCCHASCTTNSILRKDCYIWIGFQEKNKSSSFSSLKQSYFHAPGKTQNNALLMWISWTQTKIVQKTRITNLCNFESITFIYIFNLQQFYTAACMWNTLLLQALNEHTRAFFFFWRGGECFLRQRLVCACFLVKTLSMWTRCLLGLTDPVVRLNPSLLYEMLSRLMRGTRLKTVAGLIPPVAPSQT